MRWLRRDDIDVLVGIGLAVVVSVLGALGVVSDGVVLAAVLAAIGLLVGVVGALRRGVGDLEARREAEYRTLTRLEVLLSEGLIASRAFSLDYPDLRKWISSSDDILIIAGLSLKTTVGTYFADLARAADAGARVRAVCPDPNKPHLMEQAALASAYRSSGAEAANDVRANLEFARRLATDRPTVNVKVIDCLPSLGLVLFSVRSAGSEVFVKLLPFGGTAGAYPVVHLRSDVDEHLFDVFRASAEACWTAAHSAS